MNLLVKDACPPAHMWDRVLLNTWIIYVDPRLTVSQFQSSNQSVSQSVNRDIYVSGNMLYTVTNIRPRSLHAMPNSSVFSTRWSAPARKSWSDLLSGDFQTVEALI